MVGALRPSPLLRTAHHLSGIKESADALLPGLIRLPVGNGSAR